MNLAHQLGTTNHFAQGNDHLSDDELLVVLGAGRSPDAAQQKARAMPMFQKIQSSLLAGMKSAVSKWSAAAIAHTNK